jgi:hypothetical protein
VELRLAHRHLSPTRRPQVDAVTAATVLATITCGGNDVGYVPRLVLSSLPHPIRDLPSVRRRAGTFADPHLTEERFAELAANLARIAAEVRRRAPRCRLIFVDYLTLVPPSAATATPGAAGRGGGQGPPGRRTTPTRPAWPPSPTWSPAPCAPSQVRTPFFPNGPWRVPLSGVRGRFAHRRINLLQRTDELKGQAQHSGYVQAHVVALAEGKRLIVNDSPVGNHLDTG